MADQLKARLDRIESEEAEKDEEQEEEAPATLDLDLNDVSQFVTTLADLSIGGVTNLGDGAQVVNLADIDMTITDAPPTEDDDDDDDEPDTTSSAAIAVEPITIAGISVAPPMIVATEDAPSV